MKKLLGLVVTLLVIGMFGWYFSQNYDDLRIVLSIPLWITVVVLALQLLLVVFNTYFTKIVLIPLNKVISLGVSFWVTVLTTVGNFFTPFRGGMGLRAVYLKRRAGVSYTDFIATIYGTYVIVFFVNGLAGLVSQGVIWMKTGIYSLPLCAIYLAVTASMVMVSLFDIHHLKFLYRIPGKFTKKIIDIVVNIQEGWRAIWHCKPVLLQLTGFTVATFLVSIVITHLEFLAVGAHSDVFVMSLYVSFSAVAMLISVTPGSIGIREGMYLIFSQVLGVSGQQIMQLAVIDRGILFVLMIMLFIFSKVMQVEKRALGTKES